MTHKASQEFEFTHWVDKSPPEEALQHIGDTFLLFRLYTHKDATFSSKAWKRLKKEEKNFIDKHKNIDESFAYHYNEEIPF